MFRYKLKQNIIDNLRSAVANGELNIKSNSAEQVIDAIETGNVYFDSAQVISIPFITATFAISKLIRPANMTTVTQTNAETGVVTYIRSMPSTWLEETDNLPSDQVWGPTRYRTSYFSGDHLLDQVRVRYAFYDRPISGLMNVVMDNYMPKIMYGARFDTANLQRLKLPKTTYCISPWFADIVGSHQIEPEQLCRVLGYTSKDLKQLITKVKAVNYSITFVGYGGTNVNTIHWLTEIMKFTNSVNLFKFIEIVEPDKLEVSNLLRFPIHPAKVANNSILSQWNGHTASKLRLLDKASLTLLSRNKVNLSTSMLTSPRSNYNLQGLTWNYDATGTRYKAMKNHIFYGAPSIGTRPVMSAWGNFIAATHSGNGCQLWLNPTQDADLQVESYGLISLTQFFMNQLRMAIGLLETLANKVDLEQVDTQLFQYSFDGKSKLPTDKIYNFQLDVHSGTVSTETEAATTF